MRSTFLLIFFIITTVSSMSAWADLGIASFDARMEQELGKRPDFTDKEILVRKISDKIRTLLETGDSHPVVELIREDLKTIQQTFSLSKVGNIDQLNQDIRNGKLTLQARAHGPTPLFYTGGLYNIFGGESGTGLLLDEYNQIDPLETIVLSGATFQIIGVSLDYGNIIYQVATPDYPYPTETGYFIDARFVDTFWMPLGVLTSEIKHMPSQEVILTNLRNSLGLPYIWGGDIPTGVPKLLEYYAPRGLVDENLRAKWTLRGVDCSGLLYNAANGLTPRNTFALVTYGTGLNIAWKTPSEIISILKPLDIIAWKGHTMIVLNESEVIQSRADYGTGTLGFEDGVKIRPLGEVLDELLSSRIAVNNIDDIVPEGKKKFVIRRWYESL